MYQVQFFCTLITFLASCTNAIAFDQNNSGCKNALDCAANSVVSLLPDWPENFTRIEEPEGSGIIIGDGTIVATADHVLGPAKSARIRTRDGRIMNAKILLREPVTDVAFLKISVKLPPFTSTNTPAPGQAACAIGNSFGLDISISCGVVSATKVSGVGFNPVEDFIQTDAAINPGMSGGALVDGEGNFIGMVSAIFTKGSDANLGVNFATSSELLFTIFEDYSLDQKVNVNRAGILARPSNPVKADGRIGIEIVRILPDSPEDRAQLKPGDIIISANQRRIRNMADYSAEIALTGNSSKINLLVWRSGSEFNIVLNQ